MQTDIGSLLHFTSINISSNICFGPQVIHAIFNLFLEELILIPSCDQMNTIGDQTNVFLYVGIVTFHFLEHIQQLLFFD